MTEISGLLASLNEQLVKNGLCEILLISPNECKPQKKNARFFKAEKFNQLVSNIRKDSRLESVPLCYRAKNGEVYIISGHNRIDAAKAAGIENILVMLTDVSDKNEIISKQLSHNSLVGQDDSQILAELYANIDDISNKLYSGIDSNIEKISYTSLNFKSGMFKQVAFSFFEDDKEQFDLNLTEIITLLNSSPDTANYVCSSETYDYFVKCLGMIKKDCKIKSGSVALMAMCEITIKSLQEERAKKAKISNEV